MLNFSMLFNLQPLTRRLQILYGQVYMQVDEEMKKATGIHDQQYINQFPYEACLVMKHHLAKTIQKVK